LRVLRGLRIEKGKTHEHRISLALMTRRRRRASTHCPDWRLATGLAPIETARHYYNLHDTHNRAPHCPKARPPRLSARFRRPSLRLPEQGARPLNDIVMTQR
jgi:hypothetical protein